MSEWGSEVRARLEAAQYGPPGIEQPPGKTVGWETITVRASDLRAQSTYIKTLEAALNRIAAYKMVDEFAHIANIAARALGEPSDEPG